MQSSRFSDVVFDMAPLPSSYKLVDFARDLRSRTPRGMRAASALAAPLAMLVGAVGLTGLWAVMPKDQPQFQASAAPAGEAASPHQAAAVAQAAVQDDHALTHLLIELGAPVQLAPAPVAKLTSTAAQTVAGLREAEANLISAADLTAQARLKDVRETFRATGLDARPYMAEASAPAALSPLELRDARVLAACLDMDTPLARQVQRTARDLMAAHALDAAAAALPLATPVDDPVGSSPFGTRTDPFTHISAFHPGQDFSGHYGQPIHVTAPGVVSFVGQRTGYGNCVEVDHGHGFKTRYGHLEAFAAGVGQVVKTGDVIGRMGSTGRSTGVHLHYEVWASGRLLDPAPFLRAGAPTLRG